MTEVYEFHVAGLVGPVVRAALPELSVDAPPPGSVLTGTARSADEVNGLLGWLADHGLEADHILISGRHWRTAEPPPED